MTQVPDEGLRAVGVVVLLFGGVLLVAGWLAPVGGVLALLGTLLVATCGQPFHVQY